MGIERSVHTDSPIPYKGIVEDVFGVPLLPSLVPDYVVTPRNNVPDVRASVHDIVMGGVSNVLVNTRGSEVAEVDFWPKLASSGITAREKELVWKESGGVLKPARRQLVIANNVENSYTRPYEVPLGADAENSPRVLVQEKMHRGVRDFINHPRPATVPLEDPGPLDVIRGGLLTVGAVGSGKTIPIAVLMRRAGVGEQYCKDDPAVIKALAIMPAHLIPQYTGERGKNTFINWFGRHVGIRSLTDKSKDQETESVVDLLSVRRLSRALDEDWVKLDDYPVRVFDEAQSALEPRALKRVGSFGARLFLFTATPAYSKKRDLREYFPNNTVSTLREGTETGANSAVRLMTFEYDSTPDSGERAAVRLAQKMVALGKNVVIFCRPGDNMRQARRIETLLNADGGELARAIGSFRSATENDKAIAGFANGQHKVLIPTRKLRTGWDESVEVGIFFESTSPLDYEQKIGRVVRQEGTIKYLMELREKGRRTATSLWSIYGLTQEWVQQGRYIGPPLPAQEAQPLSGRPPDKLPIHTRRAHVPQKTIKEVLEELGDDGELQAMLMEPRPVRSILVSTDRWRMEEQPPEGSRRDKDIADQYGIPLIWLNGRLDRAGITFTGIWAHNQESDAQEYERWYDGEELDEYLKRRPMPEAIKGVRVTASDICTMTGVSYTTVLRIVKGLELTSVPSLDDGQGRESNVFEMPELIKILAKIDEVPQAAETDVPVADLAAELGQHIYASFRGKHSTITPVEKRRNPKHGVSGYAYHVTKEEALYMLYPPADEVADEALHIGVTEISKMADAPVAKVIRRIGNLALREPDAVLSLSPQPLQRRRAYLLRERGLALAEEIRPRKLLPTRVTMNFMLAYFDKSRSTLEYWIDKEVAKQDERRGLYSAEQQDLGGRGGEETTYPWALLRLLEKAGLPLKEDVKPIDYHRVVYDLDDDDWAYSQEVQARVIDRKYLADHTIYRQERQKADAEAAAAAIQEARTREEVAHTQKPQPEAAPVPLPPREGALANPHLWQSLESALKELRCSRVAFEQLCAMFNVEDRCIDNNRREILREAVRSIRTRSISRARIPQPRDGWGFHSSLVRFSGRSEEEVDLAIASLKLTDQQWQVCRRSGQAVEIDVCFDGDSYKKAFRILAALPKS